MAISSET